VVLTSDGRPPGGPLGGEALREAVGELGEPARLDVALHHPLVGVHHHGGAAVRATQFNFIIIFIY